MDIQVIGDEVWAEGYLVAIFAQASVPSVVVGDFTEFLENACLPEPSNTPPPDGDPSTPLTKADWLAHVEAAKTRINAASRGGILRLADAIAAVVDEP